MKEIRRLKRILNWVLKNPNSDFYRRKYRGSDIDPKKIVTLEDFRKLPFLKREEILKVEPLDRCFVAKEKLAGASISSGTTESGPIIIFEKWRVQPIRGKNVSTYELAFFSKLRRFSLNRILALGSTAIFNRVNIIPRKDMFCVFADVANLSLAAEIAKKCEIEVLWTNPSSLYFFTPYLKEKYDPFKIRYILLTGELCSKQKFKLFKSFFPKAKIDFMYGSSECGTIGWQCSELSDRSPTTYHLLDFQYMEVVDEDSGINLDGGGEGELVITSLDKRAFVPIRYRTGDIGVILNKRCKCGDPSLLFELRGRVNLDFVSVQGARLVKAEVEKAILATKSIFEDFKVHIFERVSRSAVVYFFEIELIPKDKRFLKNDQFAQKIASDLEKILKVSPKLTFYDLEQKGVFLPLKVKLVASLPSEAKRKSFIWH